MGDTPMENEEDNGEVNNFEGADDAWGDGYGDEDDDDNDAWDEAENDDDDLDDVVKQALAETKKKKELEKRIAEVVITFRPPGYTETTIARILGDFTDWVPVTMHLHQVREIQNDLAKKGQFFVKVKLVKGFRYRYKFEIDGSELLDQTAPKSVNNVGELTNYIEVIGGNENGAAGEEESKMTVQEFLQEAVCGDEINNELIRT